MEPQNPCTKPGAGVHDHDPSDGDKAGRDGRVLDQLVQSAGELSGQREALSQTKSRSFLKKKTNQHPKWFPDLHMHEDRGPFTINHQHTEIHNKKIVTLKLRTTHRVYPSPSAPKTSMETRFCAEKGSERRVVPG